MLNFFPTSSLQGRLQIPVLPECHKCGLDKTCHSPKMRVTGQGKKEILIVAEAPGSEEDRQGKQLVGQSGLRLSKALARLGIDMRRDCWLENSLRCRPPRNDITDPKWVDYCRPNVVKTIQTLNPVVIILLGNIAVKSVLTYAQRARTDAEIIKWTGRRIPSQRCNAWLCPTYHPAYLGYEEERRRGIFEKIFLNDLAAACRITKRPWNPVPNYEAGVRIMLNSDEINAWLKKKHAEKPEFMAFDYETNMLKPDDARSTIICVSICFDGKEAVAFPLLNSVTESFLELLKDPSIGKIASNMKFEERWTRKMFGFGVRNWDHDTMLTAHLLDSRSGTTGLKFQSFIHLGIEDYDDHVKGYFEADGSYAENKVRDVGIEQLLHYCALDSLYEFKVAEIQKRLLQQSPY